MIEFDGHESARRKASMSSLEIQPNWDRAFGKRLTWLDKRKIKEAWLCYKV